MPVQSSSSNCDCKQKWIDKLTGMKFKWVPGGTFEMGDVFENNDSSGPVHTVEIDGFWMAQYQVTQQDWETIMEKNPSTFKGLQNRPVENISWFEAKNFIFQLNRLSCQGFRLPTEAEWEYAARSGGKFEKFAGGYSRDLVAWNWENSFWEDKLTGSITTSLGTFDEVGLYDGHSTHPVGEKLPNGLGLYDMCGNVWEWVEDWYAPFTAEPKKNPKGPASGSLCANRGGGWCDREPTGGVTTTIRYGLTPDFHRYNLGFRVARTNIPLSSGKA